MRRLKFDFAAHPAWQRTAGLGLAAAGMLLLLAMLLAYFDAAQERTSWQQTSSLLESKRRAAETQLRGSAGDQVRRQTDLQAARAVIDRLSIPWDDLFHALEGALHEDVSLLGAEPDPSQFQIMITAEARSFDAMFAYLKRLRELGMLRGAHLLNHQVQLQDPQRPVRFVVMSGWRLREP